MADKMRTTMHNGRTNSKGEVYSPKHNDRNFDVEKAEHINPLKTNENETILLQTRDIGENATIEEHELKFYEKHFKKALEKKNETYIKNRHKEKLQTMEQFIANPRTCPEETIIQIGKKDSGADRETLRKAVTDWIEWHKKKFPQAVFLDAAAHYDEPECADHWHIRKVWIGHKDGIEVVGQNKALEEMGIERPNPEKKPTKWNNAKITYSQKCRDEWIKICQNYGLEIETKPLETSKTGLTHTEYKRRQEEEKAKAAKQEQQATLESIKKLTETVLEKIEPERAAFFRKTNNLVMNKQTYQQVITACEEIKKVSKQIAETAKATEQDRTAAAEQRRQAEISNAAEQQRIHQLVIQELEERHKQELEDKAAAAADRAKAAEEKAKAKEDRVKAEKLLKQQKSIIKNEIKKGIEKAIQEITAETTNKAMIEYFKGKQLEDGRNAYQAFLQNITERLNNRIRNTPIQETQEKQYKETYHMKY